MYYIWDKFPGQCLLLSVLSCVLTHLCLCAGFLTERQVMGALGRVGALAAGTPMVGAPMALLSLLSFLSLLSLLGLLSLL